MPYLMLNFEATREVQTEDLGDGATLMRATGAENIKLTMIDTDRGKIVELEADCRTVKQTERQPTWGEAHTASQTLGKGVGASVDPVEHDRLKEDLDHWRKRATSAEVESRRKDDKIAQIDVGLNEVVRQLKDLRQTLPSNDDKSIIAAALDRYLGDLVASTEYVKYEEAKKLYKRMTGNPWVDDGFDEDDDEEGDLHKEVQPPEVSFSSMNRVEIILKDEVIAFNRKPGFGLC